MGAIKSRRTRWTWLALVGAALISGACGDEAGDGDGGGSAQWSDPAAERYEGSPDGESDGVQSATALLEALRDRIERGGGHSDPSFDRDVQSVAAVLWAPDAGPAEQAAAQVHVQVCAIAGEVGRWLKASEEARAEREKSNPTDVSIFDAFLATAAGGPEAYRAWCAQEGAALLEAHRKASYGKFFPPK